MNEETFHNHICNYLENNFQYRVLSAVEIADREYYFVEKHLTEFVQHTQYETWQELKEEYFGNETGSEIIKAIHEDLRVKPLWQIIRTGVELKGKRIYLYAPRPRANNIPEQQIAYRSNIFAYKKEFYFHKDSNEAIDLVLYLNGLPIITVELKHHGKTGEANTCIDAINQYVDRRHSVSKIFSLPFAHFAADTDEVRVATNPKDENNFQFFNTGIENKVNPEKPEGEYPVWHLYGQAFSPEYVCDFIEYFLIYVPANTEKDTRAFTIMPRFHQLRSTRKLTADILDFAETTDVLGKKYLINHSPGAGKTLTIGWMAERLDSLNKSTRNEKVFDTIFVLTDRKSLNKNVKDDLEKFQLGHKILFTEKANDIIHGLNNRTNIIVTTIQKFNWVQEKLRAMEDLKERKVAFLIDEAHRSQGGKMGKNVRTTFIDESEEQESTWEDTAEEVFKNLDISRQVYIAFTATPTPKTLALFGKPFDVYTEDEAIQEGYILDVADNIISYKTLYHHLHVGKMKPDIEDEKLYPKGLLVKLLNDIAYEDESLIQYKAIVMIDHFEKDIREMLGGKSKAMVVTASRQAGYNYFLALNKIIEKKNLPFKILYAFSDGFMEKISKEQLTEAKVNNLEISEENPIENYFEKDEYKIMVVAHKFQQGFDEPLLCAMYLDRIVKGVNAVQTISRLNRNYPNKNTTSVIDFTNNAKEIFKAFSKYRKGAKVREAEPDPSELRDLFIEIMAYNIFTDDMIEQYLQTVSEQNDGVFAAMTLIFRTQFEKTIPDKDERKDFVNLLLKYVKKYNFLAQFVELPFELEQFAVFADLISGKLIKLGSEKSLKKSLENITIEKSSVKSLGIKKNPDQVKEPNSGKKIPPIAPKATIEEVIDDFRNTFRIGESDEIIIKEIYAETMNDKDLMELIFANRNDNDFLQKNVATQIRQQIIQSYKDKGQILKTREPLYKDEGGIFDLFVDNIIRHAKFKAEA